MMLSIVDLPEPEGPVITTNEPGCTVKLISFSTRPSPRRPTAGNTFLRIATDNGRFTGAICSPLR